MGYEAVFLSLQETFPQVDSRILRAVAFEHSNNVDAAAEFVLSEVLTSMRGPSEVIGPSREQDDAFGNQRTETTYTSHHSKPNEIASEVDVPCNSYVGASAEQCPLTPHFTGEVVEVSCTSYVDGSEKQCPITPHEEVENQPFEPTKPVDPKASDCINNAFHLNTSYLDKMVVIPYATSLDQLNAEPEALSQIEGTADTFGELEEHCSNDLCIAVQDLNKSQQERTHSVSCPNSCNIHSSQQLAYGTELVCDENDLPVSLDVRSGHVVNVDLLEDFVTNARSNKQTLASSMETVINMVQESEVLEERAKQAKEEASRAGQVTLAKVEELKQILKHAKQANDMHAGDIYGEKAILSTEARELQSRLLSLFDEKERSFSIIKEIRETLEARLAASQDEIAAAEQEKLEVEGLAQKALKEQELVMEMVVEKSQQLQQEAEDNAKLREFLMDRGQVVDTLQGELAVIFEDVMLLKERVEGRLPLSGSLLRAYSSSLSSTSSSQRGISLLTNGLDGLDLGESPRANRDDQALMQNQDNFLSNGEEMHATENQKMSEEEDWELCNDEA